MSGMNKKVDIDTVYENELMCLSNVIWKSVKMNELFFKISFVCFCASFILFVTIKTMSFVFVPPFSQETSIQL